MSANDLLSALVMSEDDWRAAEAEREHQHMETEFVTKWMPIWRLWGVTQPGYEWALVS